MNVRWSLLPCLILVVAWLCPPFASSAPAAFSSSHNSIIDRAKDELNKLLHKGVMEKGKLTCELCEIMVGTIKRLYDTNTAWNEIAKLVGDACTLFKIEDEHVCKSIAQEFKVSELLCVRATLLSQVCQCAQCCLCE